MFEPASAKAELYRQTLTNNIFNQKVMIKKITILLLLLCTTIVFKAQALECNERIETNATTPLIQVGDNKTVSSCAGLPNAVDVDITDIVTLGINFNHPDFIDTLIY